MEKKQGVAFIGCGDVSRFHLQSVARLAHLEIRGGFDPITQRARTLLSAYPLAKAYESLEQLLRDPTVSAVHILTPTPTHFDTALQCIQHGKNVFLEKPMAPNAEQCQTLLLASQAAGVRFGVNHCFTQSHAYRRLKQDLARNSFGSIRHIRLIWQREFPSFQTRRFGAPFFQSSEGLWYEIGVHLCSLIVDLLTPKFQIESIEDLAISLGRQVLHPMGHALYPHQRVSGRIGDVDFELELLLGPGGNRRGIEVRTTTNLATLDFDLDYSDWLQNASPNLPEPVAQALDSMRVGLGRLLAGGSSLARWSTGGAAFERMMHRSIQVFYAPEIDFAKERSLHASFGAQVISLCDQIGKLIRSNSPAIVPVAKPYEVSRNSSDSTKATRRPKLLVLGAAGFIGKSLVRRLLELKFNVRVIARDSSQFQDAEWTASIASGQLEITLGDLLDPSPISRALEGIETVVHAAVGHGKTLSEFLEADFGMTQRIAEACLQVGIKKFIYLSTIDVYDMTSKRKVIHEATGLDPAIERRSHYAKSKALSEQYLTDLFKNKHFPVCIIRPGVVLGLGGNLFHLAIGAWQGDSRCDLYGLRSHRLPVVLVDDVVEGIVSVLGREKMEGQSFNLVSSVPLTAEDYLRALQRSSKGRVHFRRSPILSFFMKDALKQFFKVVLRKGNKRLPSWHDWANRRLASSFDCTKAKHELDWKPCENLEDTLRRAALEPAQTYFG